ncbi:MarR family winged helix-turn-helix transcriptional regulator [Pseudorhodoferax sp.]|uniref:MarR family winged helix-turn-helix transcriptional regulator n=1 Tax=Pseudorhodoferax sp. TaxID=1993553 RepID=UPI0039E6BF71
MSLRSRRERLLAGKPPMLQACVAASRELQHAAHWLERSIDAALAPCGLHMREYLALRLLSDSAHEPLRPTTLGVTLDATRTQITRLLDALEAKGLIARAPHAHDRRSLQITLTQAGADALEQAVPLVQAAYAVAWAPLADGEVQTLARQLAQVHAHLRASAKNAEAAR